MTHKPPTHAAYESGFDPKVTLDSVFRRNVLTRPGALAISDPPDRAAITGSVPRHFNYAEADVAVNRLARQLKTIGLPDHAVVAIQLPNTVEAVLTLLAVMRCGMIALPLPMLWRRSDLVTALREIGPRALITTTRFGEERPAEIACEAAAELFTLGFPCAFGPDAPDGVISLNLDSHAGSDSETLPPVRGVSADGFAAATFDASQHGPFAVARTHSQWLTAGFSVMMGANIASGDTIISTLPPASLAGLASAFVPWLLSGGMLQLSHGFSPLSVAMAAAGSHLVAPAVALQSLATKDADGFASCIAVHRGPQNLGFDLSHLNCETIVDMQTFSEVGFTALRRIAKIMPSPIPLGEITAPVDTDGAPAVIETRRLADGTLAVRGGMVPDKPIAIGGHNSPAQLEFDLDGFVRTNLKCHASGGALVIEAMPEGILQIGGLRFGYEEIAMRVAKAFPGAQILAERDPLLGMRCIVEAPDKASAVRALDEAGLSGVIIDGIRERPQARQAAN